MSALYPSLEDMKVDKMAQVSLCLLYSFNDHFQDNLAKLVSK